MKVEIEWIARFPKKEDYNQDVLVTCEFGDGGPYVMNGYINDSGVFMTHEYGDTLNYVIAWAKFPEPFIDNNEE